jgi:hypothetical protein
MVRTCHLEVKQDFPKTWSESPALNGLGGHGGSLIGFWLGNLFRNAVQAPLASTPIVTPDLELSVNRRYSIPAAAHAIRDFRETHVAPTEQHHYSLNFTFGKISSL